MDDVTQRLISYVEAGAFKLVLDPRVAIGCGLSGAVHNLRRCQGRCVICVVL